MWTVKSRLASVKGMATAKGAATRDRIVDAAVEVLIRGGRQAVNLDEILARTRTSKGQLFHYFPGGKRDLVRAATHRHVRRMAGEFSMRLDSFEAWQGWVEAIVDLHRQQTREDACEVAALAGRILDPGTEGKAAVGAGYRLWHRHLRSDLSAMKQQGRLRSDADVDALASLFLTALQGGAVVDKATGSPDHLEPALRAALGYLRSFACEPEPI